MQQTQKETYSYDEKFQVQIAALVLRDPSFLRDHEEVVDPDYFDHPNLATIVRIGRNCFDRFGELPSQGSLVEEIREFSTAYRIPSADIEPMLKKVDQIYRLELTDPLSIRDRVIRFGRRQAMKYGVIEIGKLLESDAGLDQATEIIERASRVGMNANSLGLNLFRELPNLPAIIRKNRPGFVHRVRTGFPLLDEYTFGGCGRGDVWTVLGLSGHGKSQLLVNLGAHAIKQEVNVVYITIGDLDEEDVGLRFAARFCMIPMHEITDENSDFLRISRVFQKQYENFLRIKYYDPGTITVAHIRSYLSRLYATENFSPGLLVVDYPDELKLDSDNTYQAMGTIYSQLKTLAKQLKCVVWAASQVNRWTPRHKNDVLTRGNIADSAKKIHKADGIVSINQTHEEYEVGKARLWLDKARRGKSFRLIPLEVDYSCALIRQGESFIDDDEDLTTSAAE
jgi:KaiC/GvpD/RAD55 family RecA-like ATPase